MQKKVVLVLLMAALVAGGVFADGLSAGGGLLFDLSGNNGVKSGDAYAGIRNTSFGAYGFFDATYVEIDVSFARGSLTMVAEGGGASASADAGSVMQLGLGIMGKYPIELGSVVLFPLFGINYNMVLSWSVDGESYDKPGDLSQLGILGGVGADFGLTDSLYIRAEGLFQLRLANKLMKDMASEGSASTTLGMGPRIQVGIGYKF